MLWNANIGGIASFFQQRYNVRIILENQNFKKPFSSNTGSVYLLPFSKPSVTVHISIPCVWCIRRSL
jgi:hypothetical protein